MARDLLPHPLGNACAHHILYGCSPEIIEKLPSYSHRLSGGFPGLTKLLKRRPPLSMRSSSARRPREAMYMQPKAGALGGRSMMVVSTPATRMVRGKALAISGRPFGPSVSLSTATKV